MMKSLVMVNSFWRERERERRQTEEEYGVYLNDKPT